MCEWLYYCNAIVMCEWLYYCNAIVIATCCCSSGDWTSSGSPMHPVCYCCVCVWFVNINGATLMHHFCQGSTARHSNLPKWMPGEETRLFCSHPVGTCLSCSHPVGWLHAGGISRALPPTTPPTHPQHPPAVNVSGLDDVRREGGAANAVSASGLPPAVPPGVLLYGQGTVPLQGTSPGTPGMCLGTLAHSTGVNSSSGSSSGDEVAVWLALAAS